MPATRKASGLFRRLQGQHDQLQQGHRRKEKSLAEVAAFSVLQKNFKALLDGHMTSVQQHQKFLDPIDKACADSARLQPACTQCGLSWRSVQR